jgi:hypothetical protein
VVGLQVGTRLIQHGCAELAWPGVPAGLPQPRSSSAATHLGHPPHSYSTPVPRTPVSHLYRLLAFNAGTISLCWSPPCCRLGSTWVPSWRAFQLRRRISSCQYRASRSGPWFGSRSESKQLMPPPPTLDACAAIRTLLTQLTAARLVPAPCLPYCLLSSPCCWHSQSTQAACSSRFSWHAEGGRVSAAAAVASIQRLHLSLRSSVDVMGIGLSAPRGDTVAEDTTAAGPAGKDMGDVRWARVRGGRGRISRGARSGVDRSGGVWQRGERGRVVLGEVLC